MSSPLSRSPSPQDSTVESYLDDEDELSRNSLFMRNNSTKSTSTYLSADTFTSVETVDSATTEYSTQDGYTDTTGGQAVQSNEQAAVEQEFTNKINNQTDGAIEKLKDMSKQRCDNLFKDIDGIFTEFDSLFADANLTTGKPQSECTKTECTKTVEKLHIRSRTVNKNNATSLDIFNVSPFSNSPPTRINMPRDNTQLHRQLSEQASNLSDILDCFLDMTILESEEIERDSIACLDHIQASVPHNSTIIPNFHLQLYTHTRNKPSVKYTSTYTKRIIRLNL